MPDEFAGVSAESTLAGVAIGEGIEVGFVAGFGIESLFQYGLDGAVLRIVVVQGTPAGGLETLGAVFPDQAQSIPCTLRRLYMTSSSNRDWTRVWQALPISRACARHHVGVRLW